jgi:hypothetical protein
LKRLLAIGAAAVALFTLAGLHMAWSGLDAGWPPMTGTTLINIVGDPDGTSFQQSGVIPVTTAKGTGTWTHQGTPRAGGKQINTATCTLTAWSDSSVRWLPAAGDVRRPTVAA